MKQSSAALTGRVAVVTGTSPNIGAGLALGIAAAGARVACLDADSVSAERCAEAITGAGGLALGLACDVTDETQVRTAFGRVAEELGTPTSLVNAAGIFNMKGVLDMPVDEWRRQLEVILTGTFLCTKAAAEAMCANDIRGSIVNLTSSAAHQGEPGNIAYTTAKAGLLNFTRGAAMDLARHGIRVNSLSPTGTDPREGISRAREWGLRVPAFWEEEGAVEAFLDKTVRKVPLGALPTPSDYSDAIVFLLSDASRMITGTDLRVDAGTVAKYWRWDPGPASS
jgi:NAD(P)-dependent dehydrogenase (short-subunit alcohol dehydrogenase family)